MAQERILIVEDDPHIAKLVRYNLEKAGYTCAVASTGEQALKALDYEPVSLVILDIMLPVIDGFEVCKRIRQDQGLAAIPIIMLTARGEETDRVVGFELGADDYVVKPFSPRELVLRIKAVLNRKREPPVQKSVVLAGTLKIDIPRHIVTVDKKEIVLTLMEFDLLVLLVERRGRVQTRESLLTDVWGLDSEVETRTIDTHVKRLREKLGKIGNMIETIRGIGYKFKEA
ncbi:MAG: response regulator transcription factor [Candidatus Omnitrophica bacterium]|nr:response regulator transcription factor [Candidatus Omnitrophota bacterium]